MTFSRVKMLSDLHLEESKGHLEEAGIVFFLKWLFTMKNPPFGECVFFPITKQANLRCPFFFVEEFHRRFIYRVFGA